MSKHVAIVLGLLALAGSVTLRAQLRARVLASGFTLPVAFVQDPADRNIQFVVQQNGRIRTVRNGAVLPTDFLDVSASIVSGGEQGLLGMAFPRDANATGRFFLNFTNRSGHTVIARFRRSDPVVGDPASRFDLKWESNGQAFIAQPFSNHNGGHLAFGPDGFLYIGLGDGGSGDDPEHRAQNPNELLGKMLRIDVNVPDSHPTGYQIPPDNPFVSGGPVAARPEIWAFGLRNPWRYNFDDPARGGTGALVIGDVGQNRFEEIDFEPANRGGRNYGWRNREGLHDNVVSRAPAYTPFVNPIHEYGRNDGQSVTGGFIYRGAALGPSFQGRYLFADFVAGRVWSLGLAIATDTREARTTGVTEHTSELSGPGSIGNVSSFGVDADGELQIVGYATGRILKILGQPVAPAVPTGLRIVR